MSATVPMRCDVAVVPYVLELPDDIGAHLTRVVEPALIKVIRRLSGGPGVHLMPHGDAGGG